MNHNKQYNTLKTLHKNPQRFFGVTLVELMIAITIGSIVAIGIGSVYTSSKRSFKLQEEFSRLQENGRFAMNYIARFVRGAGYYGCSSGLANMNNDIDSTDDATLFETGLTGYEATGTAPSESITLTEDFATSTSAADFTTLTSSGNVVNIGDLLTALQPLPGSDILIARVAEDSGVEIIQNNNAAEFRINWESTETNGCLLGTATGYNGICKYDFLLVSDCDKSIAFQVSSIGLTAGIVRIVHNNSGTPGNKSAAWGAQSPHLTEGFNFGVGSEVIKVTTKFFYVGNGVNGPALFLKNGTARKQELVEGVENMQVLYGVDSDANNIPDRYVPADQADFGQVTTVRITLLLRSVKTLPWRTATTAKSYELGGMTSTTATTVTAASDQRLRRTMSMTIKLRNRAFSL